MPKIPRHHSQIQFSSSPFSRNAQLIANGFTPPKMVKTGTTICAVTFKDGVVMGCDTRTTIGNVVWEKKCEKIYKIQNNIYCAGAGSAADMEAMVKWMKGNMELHRLNTNRKFVPVQCLVTTTCQHFFSHGGAISCVFLIGGVDNTGPSVHQVHQQGSRMKLPYATMGSGSFAAMAFIETRWRPDMSEQEAKELIADAVTAGVTNDLGSGTNVDLCVIRKNSSEKINGYRVVCESGKRILDYSIKRGTTGVASKTIKEIEIEIVEEKVEQMVIE
jgi:20S proteasome subunit beta 2